MKHYKATSNGIRGKVSVDRSILHKGKPYRKLTKSRRNPSGRNSQGKLVNRRIGGGVKRRIRIIDHRWDFDNAKIIRLEYDPNRSGWIALIYTDHDDYKYIIAAHNWKPGDNINKGDYNTNSRVQLSQVRQGDLGFCLSYDKFGKSSIARAAGTWIQIMNKEDDWVVVKLPSNEIRRFKNNAWITLGKVSNIDHSKTNLGKAGTAVRLNRRPIVRGLAQNCCDHPMGGKGQHKGKIIKNRWGKIARGPRTRSPRKLSNKFIIRRRYDKK